MRKLKKNILEAVEYVVENPQISLTTAARIFGTDRHSIKRYLSLGIKKENLFESSKANNKDYLYYFSDTELKYINYYKEHSSEPYSSIRKEYPNIPDVRTIRDWMDIMEYSYHTGAIEKYHYDRTKFSKIETEEDAYWLGFITADGCIVNEYLLQIKLAERDRKHLEKFGQYIGLSALEIKEILKCGTGGAYTKDNPVVIIKICSKEIVNNLIDKGITQRKSIHEKPYFCNTIDLQKAYIRGLIDGDGYIRSTQYGCGICGSYEICEYVYNFINNNVIDISNNHIIKRGPIYGLSIGGKYKASTILRYLYENSLVYLDRKFELFKKRYAHVAVNKSQD